MGDRAFAERRRLAAGRVSAESTSYNKWAAGKTRESPAAKMLYAVKAAKRTIREANKVIDALTPILEDHYRRSVEEQQGVILESGKVSEQGQQVSTPVVASAKKQLPAGSTKAKAKPKAIGDVLDDDEALLGLPLSKMIRLCDHCNTPFKDGEDEFDVGYKSSRRGLGNFHEDCVAAAFDKHTREITGEGPATQCWAFKVFSVNKK